MLYLVEKTDHRSPEYVEPTISKDWPSVIADTASDCRDEITRIRRAKALLNLIETWGDKEWDDIASEVQSLVIDAAEDRIKSMLEHHGRASCSDRDECEIDELVLDTTIREIMACRPYRAPSPLPFATTHDWISVGNAQVLTGLPLTIEIAPSAISSSN